LALPLASSSPMLRVAAASSRLAQRAALQRAAPATSVLSQRLFRQQENLSSKAAVSKMGQLAVDPLASSSTVQGVEYVLTGFDSLVNWARKSSMWPMTFGLA